MKRNDRIVFSEYPRCGPKKRGHKRNAAFESRRAVLALASTFCRKSLRAVSPSKEGFSVAPVGII